jgi:hypothetical protein
MVQKSNKRLPFFLYLVTLFGLGIYFIRPYAEIFFPNLNPIVAAYLSIPEPLRKSLCSSYPHTQEEQDYIIRVLQNIRRGHVPNTLDQEDIDTLNDSLLITTRSGQVGKILNLDMNGDGKVTRDEIKQKYNQAGMADSLKRINLEPETKITELMNYDLNKDEVIDFDEMRHIDTTNIHPLTKGLSAYLMLAPDKKILTADELERQARKAFSVFDFNHDSSLSNEECGAFIFASVKSNKKLTEQLNTIMKTH